MKKVHFGMLFLVIFSVQDVFAQKKLKKEIGVYAMPMVAYRFLTVKKVPDNYSGSSSELKDSLIDADFPKLSLGAGVSINFYKDIYSRFEVGLRYSDQGFVRAKRDLGFGQEIHPEIGPIKDLSQTGSPKDVHFYYRFQYLQIPLMYHFAPYSVKKSDKFDFYISGGVSANILLNHTVKAKYQGWTAYGKKRENITKHEYDPSPANLNLHFGFRLHYSMDSKTDVLLSPALGLGILNANNGNESYRLWDLSIPIGFVYRFGKEG